MVRGPGAQPRVAIEVWESEKGWVPRSGSLRAQRAWIAALPSVARNDTHCSHCEERSDEAISANNSLIIPLDGYKFTFKHSLLEA
jgi:hypothetical protein